MSASVCVVMVKAPRAGSVKTRLAPTLKGAEAASLAECFARDTVESVRRVARGVIVAYAPDDGRVALEALFKDEGLLWLAQRGEDLGARIESAASDAFARGFGSVVIVGTDSPTLPPTFVESAFASLSSGETDVALGPTEDGGYYLVGLRQFFGGLFRHVEWSTPRAYRQTAENASHLGLRVLELPRWYDVDTHADLLRLRDEIFTDESARARAPSTHEWLRAHAYSLPAPV
jgi:rSAM/selenodomain-associated transferase 1